MGRSDGLGSVVESPPLLLVVHVVVLDVKSVLTSSDVSIGPNNRSVGSESGSDLEVESISQWVSVVSDWSGIQVEG